MKRNLRHNLLFAAVLISSLSFAVVPPKTEKEEEESDKYIRLMSAQSVRALEIDGKTFRRAEGPARFLHNNTWLICDTALWDVDNQIIYATGNVSIEQENTELTSDSLTYLVEQDLAKFRGALVQLRDKENNILRTNYLDYNTKDSLATFLEGAAMRDKDGQLIESTKGEYSGKRKEFIFFYDVNMFTDSVFVNTSHLIYDSPTSKATFPEYVEAWKDDRMLSSGRGWYDRNKELFFFMQNVHLMSSTQEGWSDSLYFNRNSMDVQMHGNAQVVDDERHVVSLAGKIIYTDSLSLVRMYDDPVIIVETDQVKDSLTMERDSVYFRADSLKYWTVRRCDIDSAEVALASTRLSDIAADPIAGIRKKAAEEAEKARIEALKNDPNTPPDVLAKLKAKENGENPAPPAALEATAPAAPPADSLSVASDSLSVASDSLSVASDSLSVGTDSLKVGIDSLATTADSLAMSADSLAITADSLSLVKDTTAVAFLNARGNVKIFRGSMQAICDSLVYSDLDSLARMYKDPVIWNERRHQYQADSVWIVVKNNAMDKANLMSNAFIMISEGDLFYDQIKSAEMSAYFDSDGGLKRFDAMGGASALFYIKEKERIATANKKEATVLSAEFQDGDLTQITYYESPKSDAYPVAQMKKNEQTLKGFNWRPELRPQTLSDLTQRIPRESERRHYEDSPRPEFKRTEKYFQGYMAKVYREIERSDSLRRARRNHPDTMAVDTTMITMADSLKNASADSLTVAVAPDSLTATLASSDTTFFADSLLSDNVVAPMDSLAVSDSLAPVIDINSKEYIRQQKRALAEQKRQEREAAKLARWDALDQRDALKQAKKDAKKTAQKEKKKEKQAAILAKQIKAEDKLRDKYKNRILKKMGYDRAVAGNLTPKEIQEVTDRMVKMESLKNEK